MPVSFKQFENSEKLVIIVYSDFAVNCSYHFLMNNDSIFYHCQQTHGRLS